MQDLKSTITFTFNLRKTWFLFKEILQKKKMSGVFFIQIICATRQDSVVLTSYRSVDFRSANHENEFNYVYIISNPPSSFYANSFSKNKRKFTDSSIPLPPFNFALQLSKHSFRLLMLFIFRLITSLHSSFLFIFTPTLVNRFLLYSQ